MTPIQIALLAYLAHESGEEPQIAVWGSWERAAGLLNLLDYLVYVGTERGSREMEWRTLHGRHRRGRAGRRVHVYRLAHENEAAVQLAARCAWAVRHMPKGRQHVTWKDVPAEVPSSAWPDGRRCPDCGCMPGKPCTIVLPGGCGQGCCVPAGVDGFKQCSGCQFKEEAA